MADTPMHEIEQCPACGQTRCTPNPDELRALRESHAALVTALREIASGTSGPLGRDGSSFDELFAYVTSVARAALAKAEALGAVGAQG